MSPDCLNLVPCIEEVTFLTLTPINEVILSFLTLKVNNEGTGGIILYPIDLKILKENMEDKLKEKVRRSNNLVVEIQGSVIITSK